MLNRLTKTEIILFLFVLIAQGASCIAVEVHGTIQLHSKSDFSVVATRVDLNYDISTGNSNDFAIKAAAYSGGDSVVTVAIDGTQSGISLDYRLASFS